MVRRWLLSLVAAVALSGATPAAAATHSVALRNIQFQPGSITITVGDTVTWTHEDGTTPHTVTADNGSFDQQLPAQGSTFSHVFNTPGTFRYYCKIHGGPNGQGMSGAITVQAAGPAPTTAPPPPPTTTRPPPTTAAAPATTRPSAATTTPTTTAAGAISTTPTTTATTAPTTSTPDSTTSTTIIGEAAASTKSGGGGSNGALIALVIVAVLAVISAIGYLVWRRSPSPV